MGRPRPVYAGVKVGKPDIKLCETLTMPATFRGWLHYQE